MFITPAWAQDIGSQGTEDGSLLMSLLPLVLILLVFYLMVFRPQSKRIQEHRDMVENLKKGDRVVTGGGLIGKVHKIAGEDEVVIDLADGVRVYAIRSTIMTVRDKAVSKGEKVTNDSIDSSDKKKDKITVSKLREKKTDKKKA